jgi:acetyl esterase/lipase
MTDAVAAPPYDPELLVADRTLFTPLITDHEVFKALRSAPEMTIDMFQEHLDQHDLVHEERTIPVPDGEMILSIVRPRSATQPLACLYDIHGGGMILSNRFSGLMPEVFQLIADNQLVLISPEYTLAPEARAPRAAIECHAGLKWVAEHAGELGLAEGRLILSGASGGAGIAAAVGLMARDEGSPSLLAQVLRCPMLDDRHLTVSSRQFTAANGAFDPWPTETNRFAWDLILGEGHEDREVSDYESPARAQDLSGLPPTFIDVGSNEVFRDAAVAYASKLWECGVSTELHVWPGAYHASDFMVPSAPVSRAASAARDNWIRRILGTA